MEKQIKFRLFHYFVEDYIPGTGELGLIEKSAHFGDVVDIPREQDVRRGEAMGAFFTDKERKAIEEGTYDGMEAEALAIKMAEGAGSGFPGVPAFTDAELRAGATSSISANVSGMSAEELHEYIKENKLNAKDTIALAGNDVELAEKLLDAEGMDPENARSSVITALEKIGGASGEVPGSSEEDDAPLLNASKDDWQNYAHLKGVEFDEDDTRDDIIAKVQAATES